MLMRFSKASNLIDCGGDTYPIKNWQGMHGGVHLQCMHGGVCVMHTWGVHAQCTFGACMHNVCMGVHTQCASGGAHAMSMWGVYTQCTHGGCIHNAHGGCMCNVHHCLSLVTIGCPLQPTI